MVIARGECNLALVLFFSNNHKSIKNLDISISCSLLGEAELGIASANLLIKNYGLLKVYPCVRYSPIILFFSSFLVPHPFFFPAIKLNRFTYHLKIAEHITKPFCKSPKRKNSPIIVHAIAPIVANVNIKAKNFCAKWIDAQLEHLSIGIPPFLK